MIMPKLRKPLENSISNCYLLMTTGFCENWDNIILVIPDILLRLESSFSLMEFKEAVPYLGPKPDGFCMLS